MLICGREVILIMKEHGCTWDLAVEIYKKRFDNH